VKIWVKKNEKQQIFQAIGSKKKVLKTKIPIEKTS
jgi:hypothetical protein